LVWTRQEGLIVESYEESRGEYVITNSNQNGWYWNYYERPENEFPEYNYTRSKQSAFSEVEAHYEARLKKCLTPVGDEG